MKHYPNSNKNFLSNNIKNLLQVYRHERDFSEKQYVEEKSVLLNDYMRFSKLSSCIVAVSGGIDSAIVLGIARNAMEMKDSPINKIIPVTLPVFEKGATNQKESIDKAKELCSKLKLELKTIDVSNIFNEIHKNVENELKLSGDEWARGQLVAYSRTPVLYYITSIMSKENTPSIILGTNNKDEGAYLGYLGKASDGMVDVQLISDIHKSEVYKVANFLEIPYSILNATPSGDMYDSRTDETVFGAPYDFVELYLAYLENKVSIANLDNQTKEEFLILQENLENLHKFNRHKYLACSPSVHLDLPKLKYFIEDGWTYKNWEK